MYIFIVHCHEKLISETYVTRYRDMAHFYLSKLSAWYLAQTSIATDAWRWYANMPIIKPIYFNSLGTAHDRCVCVRV